MDQNGNPADEDAADPEERLIIEDPIVIELNDSDNDSDLDYDSDSDDEPMNYDFEGMINFNVDDDFDDDEIGVHNRAQLLLLQNRGQGNNAPVRNRLNRVRLPPPVRLNLPPENNNPHNGLRNDRFRDFLARERQLILDLEDPLDYIQNMNMDRLLGDRNRLPQHNPDDDANYRHVTYDITQTGRHIYLGELNETNNNAQAYFAPGSFKDDVPVFYCANFVPTPGQEFPLRFNSPMNGSLSTILRGIFVIGHDDNFGVTADVYESSTDEDGITNVRATARQRVKIISKSRRMFGDNTYYSATVRFLPEFNRDAVSICRLSTQSKDLSTLSALTSIPEFVFPQLDHDVLISSIRQLLSRMLHNYDSLEFPSNPSQFTYFLLNFLPVSRNVKSFIIQLPTTTERLLYLKAIFSTPFTIQCSVCNYVLNTSRELIRMNHNSDSCVFVNPAGFVFELFPVIPRETITYGTFHAGFSWFNDYSWSTSSCWHCSHQVGWVFRASNAELTPQLFSTLTTSSIYLNFTLGPNENYYIDTLRNIPLGPLHTNTCVDPF